jgi:hypothetical protein
MPPLHRHPKQSLISLLWDVNPRIVGQLFQCAIKIVRGTFRGEGQFVEEVQELEGGASVDRKLGGWVQPSAQELDVLRNCLATSAVLYGDLVEPV